MKVAAIATLLLLCAAPFALDGETEQLSDSHRESAPGEFAKLSDGIVHYRIEGPENGTRVALVHGFSTPLFTWDEVSSGLTAAGFRVLRYDHFGRGLSDRPTDIDYDVDLYDRQLRELLRAVGWGGKVHLAGLSMGGAVVIEYAARHPEEVASLTLFDPAGFPIDMPATAGLIRVPLLGEYIIKTFGDRFIRQNLGSNFYDKSLVEEFSNRFVPQMRFKGFKYGQLSSLRHMPLTDMAERYREVGRGAIPVLLVWGRQDEVVPFANAELVRQAIPHLELLVVENCGHTPNYEKPEAVIPTLVRFLTAQQ